jgi:hypothetical protein
MTGLKRNKLCSFFPAALQTRQTADILAKPNLHHTRYIIRFLGSAAPSVASARRLLVLYVCKHKLILTIQCHEICKLFLSHTHLNLSILCAEFPFQKLLPDVNDTKKTHFQILVYFERDCEEVKWKKSHVNSFRYSDGKSCCSEN